MNNMGSKFDNFNEVFLHTYNEYSGLYTIDNNGWIIYNPFPSKEDKEKFHYMLQRKQFFCEAVCQKFNLPKNVTFKNEGWFTNADGRFKSNCFYCTDNSGKTRKIAFCNKSVIDFSTEPMQMFYFDEDKMVDMMVGKKLDNEERAGFDFKQNKLFVGDGEKDLNVCNSTDSDKELFGVMVNHSKAKDVFNKNGYNNFLTQNQQQQNCSTEQAPAVPMFNYCQNMGFYQNYSNNFNNFCNIYNQFYGNNSYNYCKNQFYGSNGQIAPEANRQLWPFRQIVRNENINNNIQFKQCQKNFLNQNNFNGLNNKVPLNRNQGLSIGSVNLGSKSLTDNQFLMYNNQCLNNLNCHNNINKNIHNYDGVFNQQYQQYIHLMKMFNDFLIRQQFMSQMQERMMMLKSSQQQQQQQQCCVNNNNLQQQCSVNNSQQQQLYNNLNNCNQDLDKSSLFSRDSESLSMNSINCFCN